MARVGTIGSDMTHPRLPPLRDCEGLPAVPCWLDAVAGDRLRFLAAIDSQPPSAGRD